MNMNNIKAALTILGNAQTAAIEVNEFGPGIDDLLVVGNVEGWLYDVNDDARFGLYIGVEALAEYFGIPKYEADFMLDHNESIQRYIDGIKYIQDVHQQREKRKD